MGQDGPRRLRSPPRRPQDGGSRTNAIAHATESSPVEYNAIECTRRQKTESVRGVPELRDPWDESPLEEPERMTRPLEAENPRCHKLSGQASQSLPLQPRLCESSSAKFQMILGSRVPAGSNREVQPDWSQRWTLPRPFLEKVLEDLLDADTQTRLCELTQSWSCSLAALAAQLSGCLWRCECQDKHEYR